MQQLKQNAITEINTLKKYVSNLNRFQKLFVSTKLKNALRKFNGRLENIDGATIEQANAVYRAFFDESGSFLSRFLNRIGKKRLSGLQTFALSENTIIAQNNTFVEVELTSRVEENPQQSATEPPNNELATSTFGATPPPVREPAVQDETKSNEETLQVITPLTRANANQAATQSFDFVTIARNLLASPSPSPSFSVSLTERFFQELLLPLRNRSQQQALIELKKPSATTVADEKAPVPASPSEKKVVSLPGFSTFGYFFHQPKQRKFYHGAVLSQLPVIAIKQPENENREENTLTFSA